MKSIKKLICMLFMLVLSVVNVSAAEKGTITINKAIVNESYNIYKVLDLETYDKVNNHYIYRAASGWETFLDGATDYLEARNENGDKYYVWKDGVDKSRAKEFAEKAYKYAKDNNITPTMTKKATSTSVVFDNLDLGYYLVDSSVGALLHLTTTNPTATVNEKNTLNPNVDKNVLENSTGVYGKENDDMIGSTINYKSTITTGAGYGSYVLYDKMDKGLTFNVNSVVVKIGDDVVEANNYVVKTNVTDYTFVIEFNDEFILKQPKNTNIDVYYTATLNKDATIEGDGNINETFLKYGNNITTDKKKTITYTYAFEIIKTNKEGVELTGAEFILLDKLGNEIKVILKDEETKTYRIATGNEIGVNIKAGKATIEGLDKDSYKLKEVVSPEGYNKLTSPVEFSVNGKTNDTIERTRVNVINYTGSELPETGGIGTKLFITSGLSLVLICGLVLVTKLRLYKNI
ncbi:MAG: isopeptide-forming domain-containing fimbrial protein [Tenericutes bacterium]|nr:isopeptide-forming domain-containing fimbrial protein [Mycoplasmatota bacterium]